MTRLTEKIWIGIAWMMPRTLAYWIAIRVIAHATQGPYSDQSPTDLRVMDALERWRTQ